MKALKKHNKMLFNTSKNTSTIMDLNKIKNINKESYYSLISDNISVSSRSYSGYSSISSISDWEG